MRHGRSVGMAVASGAGRPRVAREWPATANNCVLVLATYAILINGHVYRGCVGPGDRAGPILIVVIMLIVSHQPLSSSIADCIE